MTYRQCINGSIRYEAKKMTNHDEKLMIAYLRDVRVPFLRISVEDGAGRVEVSQISTHFSQLFSHSVITSEFFVYISLFL